MTFNVNQFKTKLSSGARPNLFDISIYSAPVSMSDAPLLCKATTIPAFTVGVIEVPFRGGRRIKVPGDRTFAEWSATFISDENQTLFKNFHRWMDFIKDTNYNTSFSVGARTLTSYDSTIIISHYGDSGNTIAKYALVQAFPTDIAQVDLSYDTTDTIGEFTVTFQYQYQFDTARRNGGFS